MPADGEAWRDVTGRPRRGRRGAVRHRLRRPATGRTRPRSSRTVQDLGAVVAGTASSAAHVWSLWTRYVCTAFYSHPWAWNEIGFGGPAYPRGYKNLGIDRREPYEVARRPPAATTRSADGLARSEVSDGAAASGPATSPRGCCPRRPGHQPPAARRTCAASTTDDEVDLVIVGCGAGGATLMQRLARAGWRVVALDAGPFWDPDTRLGERRGAARTTCTGPSRASIGGADPVPLGSNNSGRGVGGSMVHYAGYTPRFHPQRLPRPSASDGVGADWPIDYARPAALLRATSRRSCRSPASTGRGATRTATRTAPHPVGGNGEIFLRGAARCGHRRPGSVRSRSPTAASATGRTASTAGFCLQGCKVNAKAVPLITHVPDALAHGAEVRADAMVTRIEVDERTGPGHRRALRARAASSASSGPALVAVAGYSIETPRLLLNSASPRFPRRAGQRPRPGRPLPDGPGRAADGGPVRRRDPDVQGAAAGGQHRAVLRDRPRPSPTGAASPSRPSRPLPITWAEHVSAQGHWGARCASTCATTSTGPRLGALCEFLPQPGQPGHPGRRDRTATACRWRASPTPSATTTDG